MVEKSKKKYTLICPKCKSIDVSNDFSDPGMVFSGSFYNRHVCNHCGFISDFFPEVEIKLSSKKKKSK